MKQLLLFFLSLIAGFTNAQNFINYELKSTITHVQPFTGIVFWTDNGSALNELKDKVQMEFSYMVPSDVVIDSGMYNWTKVENTLNQAKNRNHQAIIRFRYTYPGVTKPSVPTYIRNRSDYTSQIKKVENQNTFIPDWSNEELKRFTLEFFQEFATKYDNDPRLAYLQVGFGSYSEYHLYDGPFEFGKTFPTKTFQEQFLNEVNALMIKTPWSISIDAADGSMSPMESKPTLQNLNFGLFDDSFMHQEHSKNNNEYNRASWLFFGADRWKTKVAGGEFSYYTDYDQEHVLDLPDGPHGRNFESFVNQYHISYIIGNDQFDYQTPARIEEAALAMGYKFKVSSYTSDGNSTKVVIENTGITPLYFDAYPALGNIKSTTSLKGLLPNESRSFTIATAINQQLAITCDKLVAGQAIEFEADLEGIVTEIASVEASSTIYPNPSSTGVFQTKDMLSGELFNAQGQRIQQLKNVSIIDISDQLTGIYFLVTPNRTIKLIR